MDFVSGKDSGYLTAQDIKADLNEKTTSNLVQTPEAVPAQAQNVKKTELKIKVLVKSAGMIKEKRLTCQPGPGADKISDCTKKDLKKISYDEVNTLALRQYLSPETLKFVDLLN